MKDSPSTHYALTAKISLTQAIGTALKEVPGVAYKAKLKEKKGLLVYKVSVVTEREGTMEVKLDPDNGKVLGVKPKGHDKGESEGN